MRNFKELKIWQKGFKIAVDSFKLVSAFPREEKFGIAIQNYEGCCFYSFQYC
jgi:hypothetical protein